MNHFNYYLLLFSCFIFFSCNRIDEDTDKAFNKEEWCKHVDITSDFIIFIPDIQVYIYDEDKISYLVGIVNRILELNDNGFKVKAVVQSGDITDHNTLKEWETAKRVFSKLDNKIPYIMCLGNHDYGDFGHCNNRFSHYSDYFNYRMNSSFVSSFKKNNYDNSFFRILIHEQPFQIFSLEFAPTDNVIAWADSIAKANKDEIGIVLTHAYLYKNNVRFDFSKYGYKQNTCPYDYDLSSMEKVNDGEEIWQKLIYPNKSIRFTLCGHMAFPDYVGNLVSENSFKKSCLQLLFDAQSFPNGGDGWIQILEFKNDLKSVKILTYSAISNIWLTSKNNQYQFIYD